MAQIDIRNRAGYWFLALVVGHIILISAQVNSRAGVPVLETVTFGLFARVQHGVAAGVFGVRRIWSGYLGLRWASVENESLKQQLADIQIDLQQERALAERSRRLEKLLELRDQTALTTKAAEIIAASASPDFRTVTIDKGRDEGLRKDMAVIAPAGVVGRVVVPSAHAAKVQLLIDRNAAAGVVIERTRAQGLIVGTGEDRLRMDYVSEASDIAEGDVVVTSGIDGIFPKGFVVGQIESVEKNGPAFKRILVRPAVDFRTLEEVLVVIAPPATRDVPAGNPE